MIFVPDNAEVSDEQKRGLALIQLLIRNVVLLRGLNEAVATNDTSISAHAVLTFVRDICSVHGDGAQLMKDITDMAAGFGIDIKTFQMPQDLGRPN